MKHANLIEPYQITFKQVMVISLEALTVCCSKCSMAFSFKCKWLFTTIQKSPDQKRRRSSIANCSLPRTMWLESKSQCMGTLLGSDSPTDSLPFQECLVRLSAKWAHKSEVSHCDKLIFSVIDSSRHTQRLFRVCCRIA